MLGDSLERRAFVHMGGVKTVIIIVFGASALTVGSIWTTSIFQSRKTIAKLVVPPGAFDMGTVWESDRFAWTVPIENQGSFPVEIESFSTSCNCLSIEPQSLVIEPGEQRELRLEIDLVSQTKSTGQVAVKLWPRLKTTTEANSANTSGPEWTVTGRVSRVLVFSPNVFLGRHSELSQPLASQTISLETLVPLASLTAESGSPSFSASIELPQGGGRALLKITPTHSLPVGSFDGTIRLKPILNDGESLPVRQVRFSGSIVPDIVAEPPAVQVGGRQLGERFEKEVVLRSLTGRSFPPARAEAEGDGLSLQVLEEGMHFRVRQEACATGTQTTHVRFRTESAGREVVLVVPVCYTGIERR